MPEIIENPPLGWICLLSGFNTVYSVPNNSFAIVSGLQDGYNRYNRFVFTKEDSYKTIKLWCTNNNGNYEVSVDLNGKSQENEQLILPCVGEIGFLEKVIEIDYLNWENIKAKRNILPHTMKFGNTNYYKNSWLLEAVDLKSGMIKEFSFTNIYGMRKAEYEFPRSPRII